MAHTCVDSVGEMWKRMIWGKSGWVQSNPSRGEEKTIKGHAWDKLPTTALAAAPSTVNPSST